MLLCSLLTVPFSHSAAGLIKEQRDEIARLKSHIQELENSQSLQIAESKLMEITPQVNPEMIPQRLGQDIIPSENINQDMIPQGRQEINSGISPNRPAPLKKLGKWARKALGLSRSKTGSASDGVH